MKAFLKNVGFSLLLMLGLATLISAGSLWALRRSDFYKPSFLANSVTNNHFDYIILGASTGLTTLNTQRIDSLNGTKGINLSMDDTSLPSQYLMLQHFLAEGKTTKFCVLAPSNASFDLKHDGLSDNDYRFLMYVNKPYVYKYYEQFDTKQSHLLQGSKWMPMLGVSFYNAELFYPSLLSLAKPRKRNRFDGHGNYTYPFIKFNDSILTNFEPLPITFENRYVKKIKDLCEANGIQLICYFSPMMDQLVIAKSDTYNSINHSNLLKNARYFNDAIHVNYLGNQLTSRQFAKDFKLYLKANKVIDAN